MHVRFAPKADMRTLASICPLTRAPQQKSVHTSPPPLRRASEPRPVQVEVSSVIRESSIDVFLNHAQMNHETVQIDFE
jgi:hypothetical protein